MIHSCLSCGYSTNIKCNMKRHCISLHGEEYDSNIMIGAKMENIGAKMENNVLQCKKCNKILTQKRYLIKHQSTCTGVTNSLECYICHKIFETISAKCKHIKKCKERALIIKEEHEVIPTNIVNNNGIIIKEEPQVIPINTTTNINNGIINNNTTINYNIVIYKDDYPDNFSKNHITSPELKKTLKIIHRDLNDEKKVIMIEDYVRKLLINPDNRCIKKTNMRDAYSRVHIGDNNWISKPDTDLYPQLTCNIAEGLSDLIYIRNEEQRMITELKLQELQNFLNYMTDNGYRNDEDKNINLKTKLMFKKLVKRIKGVVFDVTKIKI